MHRTLRSGFAGGISRGQRLDLLDDPAEDIDQSTVEPGILTYVSVSAL